MYEESSRGFSIRGLVITILLIILIVCILLWLFPIKKDTKDNQNNNNQTTGNNNNDSNISTNDRLLNDIFGRNLRNLQLAGHAYFYNASLPKNVGDKVNVKLAKLIEKKTLLELKDKNGESCDAKLSYVELTKIADSEYELKSYLKCNNEANYLIDNVKCSELKNGCKSDEPEPTPDVPRDDKDNNDDENPKQPTKKVEYYYRYLYSCLNSSTSYSSWSGWTTNYISGNSNREVETKVEYERKYVKVGTKEEAVTTDNKQTTIETVVEEQSFINYKPANAKSCVEQRKSSYTLYTCQVEVQKEVTVNNPTTTYKTVDVYDWRETPVTYYRYRTINHTNNEKEYWSTSSSDYRYQGCTIISTEKVAK